MKLKELLKLTKIETKGCIPETEVTGLTYDSRKCKKGFLFFATDGIHTDGHQFIKQAKINGAIGAIVSNEYKTYDIEDFYLIPVKSPRQSMALFASAFYSNPSSKMKIIGVTGTDGKSSTVSLIHQLLQLADKKSGFISTVEYQTGDEVKPNPFRQSTPEAIELQSLLAEMVEDRNEFAVVEATSHGLAPQNNRLGGIQFQCAVFTNVTREHLEFHGTVEQYQKDKAELFKLIQSDEKGGFAVINGDDPNYQLYVDTTKKNRTKAITYGIKNPNADCIISNINKTHDQSSFTLNYNGKQYQTHIELAGQFNIENATAAWLIASNLLMQNGHKDAFSYTATLLPKLKPIKGRMNRIAHHGDFELIIDYAHTPGSFEKIFPALRKQTQGRLIAVFGSAGERDKGKRAIQGSIADQFADIIILTDEDPRLEDSMGIIEEIATGCTNVKTNGNLYCIPNRMEAIQKAIGLAKAMDTVILLGKGHESSIIYGNDKLPWDEEKTARRGLQAAGYLD